MVASVGIPVNGWMAAKEPSGQSALAGEAGAAFAIAVDEAAVQGGLKGMAGILAEGEPGEKDEEKPDPGLCLPDISALLMQGAYHIAQATDTVAADDQKLSLKSGLAPEYSNKGQASLGGAAAMVYGAKSREADPPGTLTALQPVNSFKPNETALEEAVGTDTGNAMPEPAPWTAEVKHDFDQVDPKGIHKPLAQSVPEPVQLAGANSLREAVQASNDVLGEGVRPRGTAAAAKPDRETEKPVMIPAAGMVMASITELAASAEKPQSAQDVTPGNTVREENAAIQVARASVRALKRGTTEYRVRLSPEGLGEVEVTVVAKGRTVSLSLRTQSDMARGLILDHVYELRSELNQQNYQVSGLSVEVGMDSGDSAGSFTPGEYAGPVFDTGRMNPDPEAADAAADRGPQGDSRPILPRSSTISYRI